MGVPGGFELLAILAIVVLIFGGKKIPELMKGIGSGIKNFKQAVKTDDEIKAEVVTTNVEKTAEKKEETTSTSPKPEAPKQA